MGLRKHLSTAEIVEQVVLARKLFTSEFGSITNVVFMVSTEKVSILIDTKTTILINFSVFV